MIERSGSGEILKDPLVVATHRDLLVVRGTECIVPREERRDVCEIFSLRSLAMSYEFIRSSSLFSSVLARSWSLFVSSTCS
jgi:hypothetical protein